MRERVVSALRLLCLGLAVLTVVQAAALLARRDPLDHLTRPASLLGPGDADPEPSRAGTNTTATADLRAPKSETPPAVRARVERITASEIFGPVPRPPSMPLALLGIGGRYAFLRAPTGQTGLVREGQEWNGIKLVQIGVNRVLVELQGHPQELTIFSGFGGQSLLPKRKENAQ